MNARRRRVHSGILLLKHLEKGYISMANEPNKIIYSMIKVSKKYNQKQILKDISLSYFYGA